MSGADGKSLCLHKPEAGRKGQNNCPYPSINYSKYPYAAFRCCEATQLILSGLRIVAASDSLISRLSLMVCPWKFKLCHLCYNGDQAMKLTPKTFLAIIFSGLFVLLTGFFMPTAGFAEEEYFRTSNRNIFGRIFYPERFYARPDHYEFLPQNSNRDPHPAAGAGQEWDPRQWNPKWTPDVVIRKLFKARVFERQYMRNGQIPVVELGPVFYELSDLDRRRTLKLVVDHGAIFKRGYGAVELVDWSTRHVVGSYTPKGMFLN